MHLMMSPCRHAPSMCGLCAVGRRTGVRVVWQRGVQTEGGVRTLRSWRLVLRCVHPWPSAPPARATPVLPVAAIASRPLQGSAASPASVDPTHTCHSSAGHAACCERLCPFIVHSAASAVENTTNQHSLSTRQSLPSYHGWIERSLATAGRSSLRTVKGCVLFNPILRV
jgi:hypothetical protein